MEYKIIKKNSIGVLSLEMETFDYYSNNSKPLTELFDRDKKILNLLQGLSKGQIYVLAKICFVKEQDENIGLWKYHSLPNDEPLEDFKYQVDFIKPLSEYKFSGEKYNSYVGVAEISIDFYIQNYMFFNRFSEAVLFFCKKDKIGSIIDKIKTFQQKQPEDEMDFNFDYLAEIVNANCIIIKTDDNEEFKEMKIMIKKEETLLERLKAL